MELSQDGYSERRMTIESAYVARRAGSYFVHHSSIATDAWALSAAVRRRLLQCAREVLAGVRCAHASANDE
jgi:hypothetical protein